jgi:hypothetical protein
MTLKNGRLEVVPTNSQQEGSIMKQTKTAEALKTIGTYSVTCFDANGNLKWEDSVPNVITTVGKNDILDKYFAGSAYTASMFMGLISGTSYTSVPVIGDTQASHATWNECGAATYGPDYSNATRPAVAWNSAAAGSKASTATTFTVSSVASGVTVKGCLISTNNTKQGTTGTLVSAGLFSGGDKTVAVSDVLNVTYTAQLT